MAEPLNPGSPARGSRRLLWLTSTAVILLVVAIGLAITRASGPIRFDAATGGARYHDEPRISATLPGPRTINRNGVTYTARQASLAAAKPVPGTARPAVNVFMFAAVGGSPGCTVLNPSARIVRQDPDEVVVAGFDYVHPTAPDPNGASGCSYITVRQGGLYRPIRLALAMPLGHRRLIDADSGDLVGRTDQYRRLTPGYLPAGYVLTGRVGTFDAASSFFVVQQYQRDRSTIEIHTRSAGPDVPTDRVLDELSVDGHHARAIQNDFERCVMWDDGRGFEHEVCALTDHDRGSPLSVAELAKIARGLH